MLMSKLVTHCSVHVMLFRCLWFHLHYEVKQGGLQQTQPQWQQVLHIYKFPPLNLLTQLGAWGLVALNRPLRWSQMMPRLATAILETLMG